MNVIFLSSVTAAEPCAGTASAENSWGIDVEEEHGQGSHTVREGGGHCDGA